MASDLVSVLIDVWDPENVSLGSLELWRAQRTWERLSPTVGYLSWFGDRIVKSDLPVLTGVTLGRHADGTLVSLDLGSPTLLEDGLALVEQIHAAGLLLPLPDEPARPAQPVAQDTTPSLPDTYALRAEWGGRAEPAEQVTARIWDTLTGLARLGGVFALPWWTVSDDPIIVSADRATFDAHVSPQAAQQRPVLLTQHPDAFDPDAPPHGVATFLAGQPVARASNNQIVLTFASDQYVYPRRRFPADQILPFARAAVEHLVDVWSPDAASLEAPPMHRNQTLDIDHPGPALGLVTWVQRSLIQDPAPDHLVPLIVGPHKDGTLYSMDLDAPDLEQQASALAYRARNKGGFDAILPIQGDPSSEKHWE
ncbi:MAG: hypothetical protein LBS56_00700 [Propionibacteriaceae bacterium]|nr:hypothetical protein [Propionibacteriaceae bacterium]